MMYKTYSEAFTHKAIDDWIHETISEWQQKGK